MMFYRDDDLWQAVGGRDLAAVRRALAAGGDVNMVCPDGWVRDEVAGKRGTGRSLLHHAAWAGDMAIFRTLVEAKADVGRRRTVAWRPNGGVRGRGSTPLHHAVMYNRRPIVEYLVQECSVDLDEPGEQGYTALHLAAKFDYPDIAELLLREGARSDLITRDEKTVHDLARGQQDRSHAQQGAVSRLLELYDKGGASRQRALPGAPRPQRPPRPRPPAAPDGALATAEQPTQALAPSPSAPSRLGLPRPSPVAAAGPRDALDVELQRHASGDSLHVELRRQAGTESPVAGQLPSDAGGGRGPGVSEAAGGVRGAYHDPSSGSQNVGNHIGTRSSVRQSRLFRMYESGNATKALLGQQSLQWDVMEKEGAYQGRAFDPFSGQSCAGSGDGRDVIGRRPASLPRRAVAASGMSADIRRPVQPCVVGLERGDARWSTSSSAYGATAVV